MYSAISSMVLQGLRRAAGNRATDVSKGTAKGRR
jgi:hypothetical protein